MVLEEGEGEVDGERTSIKTGKTWALLFYGTSSDKSDVFFTIYGSRGRKRSNIV